MASVTHRSTTASTSNVSSYTTGSFTPVANELLIVFVRNSASVGTPSLTDTQGLGWTLVTSANSGSNANRTYVFVANALAAATSMTVTYSNTDSATGAIIFVAGVSGITRVGSQAIRQSQVVSNHSTGTPTVSFSNAALTGNPVIGHISNPVNPSNMTPPSGFTELADTGYSTPTTGAEYASVDSGFTGTAVTWGSSSGGQYAAIIVELDTSAPVVTTTLTQSLQYAIVGTPSPLTKGITYLIEDYMTYSRQASGALPSNDTDLGTYYTTTEKATVATADDSRVEQTSTDTNYVIHQFKRRNANLNNTDPIAVTWEGQVATAPSSKTVYLQVYNHTTSTWNTLASDSSSAAGTDFQLTATVSTSLSSYYNGAHYEVSFRVYQDA